MTNRDDRQVGIWLLVIVGFVFAMIVVGGATRLTESGLSMTNWHPISGIVPPLNAEEWQAEFEAYKQYPEYKKVNRGMALHEFKAIFWWEYGHRVLGRTIGFVFFIPFVWFWRKGRIRKGLMPKLVGLFVLGGLQGLLGWYMVKSGLVDQPDVSHYRLAAHLMVALVILAWAFWLAMNLLRVSPADGSKALLRQAQIFTGLVFLQMALGAFVAGSNAGLIYNTWPLMDGSLVPSGLLAMQPWWMNFTESHLTMQFNHRIVAYLIAGLAIVLFVKTIRGFPAARIQAIHIAAFVGVQILLGILTLIYVVPVLLGTLHQAGGVLVLMSALWFAHRVRPVEG